MIAVLALAAAQLVAPPEPLRTELMSAIWADLELNGMIGNNSEVARRWLNLWGQDPDNPYRLRILNFRCQTRQQARHCRFRLLRSGGTFISHSGPVSDRITCQADFVRRREDGQAEPHWRVKHLPPPEGGGHSVTTLQCTWDQASASSPPPAS